MKKQTIIVTGAASGIGKGIAAYFLSKGDNVVINSVTPQKLEQAFNELGAGGNLAMVAGDVGSAGNEQTRVESRPCQMRTSQWTSNTRN